MKALSRYFDTLKAADLDPSKLASALETFQSEQTLVQSGLVACTEKSHEILKKKERKSADLWKATRDARNLKAKANAEKQRRKDQKHLAKLAKEKEKRRIRDERVKYWPKKVYKVTVSLDVPADTPGSSRRSSVSEITLTKEAEDVQSGGAPRKTHLLLSYITTSASWAPRYDIEFFSSSKTGKIGYRAEFYNHTSETWKDAKISLSTSKASFSGLNDTVPHMNMWPIGLTKNWAHEGGLASKQESSMVYGKHSTTILPVVNRQEIFGLDSSQQRAQHFDQRRPMAPPPPPLPAPAQAQAPIQMAAGALFGASQASVPHPPTSSHMPLSRSAPSPFRAAKSKESQREEEAADESVFAGGPGQIDFEDLSWEDHGLVSWTCVLPSRTDNETNWSSQTTTYELPGSRTLSPSSLTRRHKIASLPFANLVLTSISVPKLRAAAFMRARFRNPSSSITLLKGTAGLTLDSTYLGSTTLPRVSPNELVTLPLGVDPAVHVSYAKPTVKRSTQGFINKEASQLFTRSIIITNTKPIAIHLLVLDQIPVSEDERLKVDLSEPRGLNREGDTVSTGVNAREGKDTKPWGKAKAELVKNGEVAWNVDLERGAAVKLKLEYETKAPSSEVVISK